VIVEVGLRGMLSMIDPEGSALAILILFLGA